MKKILSKLLPKILKIKLNRIREKLFDVYVIKSYSQEGEDMVLQRIFSENKNGFFVDVGAHHPKRFSNTYFFYKKGWRGINIEPNPDSLALFKKYRSNDINLNIGIALEKATLDYYMFDDGALNTFDIEVLNNRIDKTLYKHTKTISVKVLPLEEVFSLYCAIDKKIDFLTIDVEGLDLEVLKSNNWKIYRPSWVLVEQLHLENIENLNFDIHFFMKSLNYALFAKTYNTLFYKDDEILK